MTNVLSQSSEVRQAFQDRVEQAVESLSVSTVMPNEVDAALMQVSMDMFGGLAPECAPKPWQTSEVQITLKQVWAGRTELRKVQSRLLSGENVHGVLAVWKKWAQFQKLRKQLRKASAEKRRQRWDTQLQEAEQALDKGDAHAFYSAIKRMAPRVERGRVQLRSKTGDVLTVEEVYLRWRKVFDVRSLPAQDWFLLRPMDIGLDEVHAAIQALAARRASMPGTVPGVAWKFGGPSIAELMWGILQREWGAGKLQHDSFLTRSWLHFLEKPGRTLRDPSDLRPIALQPVASKVFSALIRNKLKPYLDQIILRYPQYAYVEGRGTAEAISRVAQHCSRVRNVVRGQKQDLRSKFAGIKKAACSGGCQLSIDLSRAFDSVPRSALLRAMEWASIPADLCALVISWHEASTYILGDRSDAARWREIHVTRGVKQGCVVAPALWTLFSCYVWSQLDALAGSLWNAEHTTGYADDFHFQWELSAYKQCRQVGLDIDMIFSTLQAHGLQINPEKSHFLVEVRGSDAEKWLRKHKVPCSAARCHPAVCLSGVWPVLCHSTSSENSRRPLSSGVCP